MAYKYSPQVHQVADAVMAEVKLVKDPVPNQEQIAQFVSNALIGVLAGESALSQMTEAKQKGKFAAYVGLEVLDRTTSNQLPLSDEHKAAIKEATKSIRNILEIEIPD